MPRTPLREIKTTSNERKIDYENIIRRYDLCARAWESVFGKPIFDKNQDEPSPPNPREVNVEADQSIAETCSKTGITQERLPVIFLPTDGLSEGTDTDQDRKPIAEVSSEHLNPNPTNYPRSTQYDLRHSPKPNCNGD